MSKLKDTLFKELIEIEAKIKVLRKKNIKKRLAILKKRRVELRTILNLKDKPSYRKTTKYKQK